MLRHIAELKRQGRLHELDSKPVPDLTSTKTWTDTLRSYQPGDSEEDYTDDDDEDDYDDGGGYDDVQQHRLGDGRGVGGGGGGDRFVDDDEDHEGDFDSYGAMEYDDDDDRHYQ